MIVVVLGMHKSGTTLVSQILHRSGIPMGDFDESVSYDRGNKYEREATLALDMEIMRAPDDEVLDLAPPRTPALTPDQRARMRAIIAGCQAAHRAWGFKDPRACLLYDLWAQELPPHRIVAVYRDPAEVWSHFKWSGPRWYHTNFHRAYAYLNRWHEHNAALLRILAATPQPWIMVGYRELMADDGEFARLQDFLGRPLQDARKPGLYRNRPRRDLFLRTADRLLKWRHGISVDRTMDELGALRSAGSTPAAAPPRLGP